MDNQNLLKVINDHFGEEPEVLETAMYALSTLNISDAILRGTMIKATEIRGIPPESYALMKTFDNGLTINSFWLENFAPIKMQMALDDIKLNTIKHYVGFMEKQHTEGKPVEKPIANSIRSAMLSRCDVLTVIAFLWKGIEFANEFDYRYRSAIQLTQDYEQYFAKLGV